MESMTDDAVQPLVDEYIARFQERSRQLGTIKRFYAYVEDDLAELQWKIQELDPSEQPLYDAMIELYSQWLDEMSPEERQELFDYNRQQKGEWRSHLLEEDLEPRYAASSRQR